MMYRAKQELDLKEGTTVEVSLQVLEVYNNKLFDLLEHSDQRLIQKREKAKGFSCFKNDMESQDGAVKCIFKALRNRKVGKTNRNAKSSRGHAVVMIHFTVNENGTKATKSTFSICDLAGIETQDDISNKQQKESIAINESLHHLRAAVNKSVNNMQPICRECQLTWLLKNSLQDANSKTLALVCCSSLPENFRMSRQSIEFAGELGKVEVKK
jgi:predicted DNA-binding antitoxin AbrB/MazE fold protein